VIRGHLQRYLTASYKTEDASPCILEKQLQYRGPPQQLLAAIFVSAQFVLQFVPSLHLYGTFLSCISSSCGTEA